MMKRRKDKEFIEWVKLAVFRTVANFESHLNLKSQSQIPNLKSQVCGFAVLYFARIFWPSSRLISSIE